MPPVPIQSPKQILVSTYLLHLSMHYAHGGHIDAGTVEVLDKMLKNRLSRGDIIAAIKEHASKFNDLFGTIFLSPQLSNQDLLVALERALAEPTGYFVLYLYRHRTKDQVPLWANLSKQLIKKMILHPDKDVRMLATVRHHDLPEPDSLFKRVARALKR